MAWPKKKNFTSFYSWIIFHCMYIPHFIYPFICWWSFVVSTFWLLWIMLLWTLLHKYLFESLFSFEYISRSGIAGSYGKSMVTFSEEPPKLFHNGCTILLSLQLWTRVPIFPYPYQHLLVCVCMCACLNSHPNKCEEALHCGSGFTFLTSY